MISLIVEVGKLGNIPKIYLYFEDYFRLFYFIENIILNVKVKFPRI